MAGRFTGRASRRRTISRWIAVLGVALIAADGAGEAWADAGCRAARPGGVAVDIAGSKSGPPCRTEAMSRDSSPDWGVRSASNNVMIFGGQFTTVNMSESVNPFATSHESQRIVGIAFGRDVRRAPAGFVIGTEFGFGHRFGLANSDEAWGGLHIRNTGIALFNVARIAAGITVGLSYVTTPTGTEAERQALAQGNAHLLGYLGPEVALVLQRFPNLEWVYRLQHRSGAQGLFGRMHEGSNVNVFGVRRRF